MGVELLGPGVYVPNDVITNRFLETVVDTDDAWIRERTGIGERRMSFYHSIKEMALLATQDLITKTGLDPKSVDEVISATNFSENNRRFPPPAGYVAYNIGRSNIATWDLTAGCTGLIFAIRNAYNAIANEEIDTAIAVGVERLTEWTDFSDRGTCILFGDGAGAYALRKCEGDGIINVALGGQYDVGDEEFPHGFLTTVRKKGTKLRKKGDLIVPEHNVVQDYIVMNGQGVFKFATKAMQKAIRTVLKDTGYDISDVDVIIPHGANQRIVDNAGAAVERKGFKGIIYTNLEMIGNTSTASIPLAENEAINKGVIKNEDLVLKVGFGAGLTWGATLERKRGL